MAGISIGYSSSGLFWICEALFVFPASPATLLSATRRMWGSPNRQRNSRLRQFLMKFWSFAYSRSNHYLSYHHFDAKQPDCLVACTAFLRRTSAAREQNSLQCLSVSSVAGEHLVKDIDNLTIVLLKVCSLLGARRASSSTGTGAR